VGSNSASGRKEKPVLVSNNNSLISVMEVNLPKSNKVSYNLPSRTLKSATLKTIDGEYTPPPTTTERGSLSMLLEFKNLKEMRG
jgi:hypothetical protein